MSRYVSLLPVLTSPSDRKEGWEEHRAALAEWYACRARYLEEIAGLADDALALMAVCCQGGIGGEEEHVLRRHLVTLCALVYDGGWLQLTLAEIQNLSPSQVVEMLVRGPEKEGEYPLDGVHVPLQSYLADLKGLVSEDDAGTAKNVYFETVAAFCAVLEIVACPALDKWAAMQRLLGEAQDALQEALRHSPPADLKALHTAGERMAHLGAVLRAGALLSGPRYGLPFPPQWLHNASGDEEAARSLVGQVLRHFLRSPNIPKSEQRWRLLLEDLLLLRGEGGCMPSSLATDLINTQYCESLLRSGGNLPLAASFLRSHPRLNGVARAAALHLFHAAAEADDEVVEKAIGVLSLTHPSPQKAADLAYMEGYRTLCLTFPEAKLLASQYSLLTGSEVVERVLHMATQQALGQWEKLVEIAWSLEGREVDDSEEKKDTEKMKARLREEVMCQVAECATQKGDMALAQTLCNALLKAASAMGASACGALAMRRIPGHSVRYRRALLVHALKHCAAADAKELTEELLSLSLEGGSSGSAAEEEASLATFAIELSRNVFYSDPQILQRELESGWGVKQKDGEERKEDISVQGNKVEQDNGTTDVTDDEGARSMGRGEEGKEVVIGSEGERDTRVVHEKVELVVTEANEENALKQMKVNEMGENEKGEGEGDEAAGSREWQAAEDEEREMDTPGAGETTASGGGEGAGQEELGDERAQGNVNVERATFETAEGHKSEEEGEKEESRHMADTVAETVAPAEVADIIEQYSGKEDEDEDEMEEEDEEDEWERVPDIPVPFAWNESMATLPREELERVVSQSVATGGWTAGGITLFVLEQWALLQIARNNKLCGSTGVLPVLHPTHSTSHHPSFSPTHLMAELVRRGHAASAAHLAAAVARGRGCHCHLVTGLSGAELLRALLVEGGADCERAGAACSVRRSARAAAWRELGELCKQAARML